MNQINLIGLSFIRSYPEICFITNLYQIFTYVKTKENELSEVPHEKVAGMLLYAQTEEEGKFDNEYQMIGNRICVRTLDLSGDFPSIKKAAR